MGLARNYDSTNGTSGGAVTFTPDFNAPAKVWLLQNLSATESDIITFSLVGKDYKVRGGRALKLSLVADSVTISGSGASYVVRCADVPSAVSLTLKASAGGGGGGSAITGEIISGSFSDGGRAGFSTHIVISNQSAAFTGTRYFALPTSPEAWVTYVMKDGKGDAATNNIDIASGSGSHTIDGSSASAVISSNFGSLSFVFDGISNWSIV